MNPLHTKVGDIISDQLDALLRGILPAEWPTSGDEIARFRNGD